MIIVRIHTLDHSPSEFEGTEPISFLDVEDDGMMSFSSDVHYCLRATLVSGGVLVEGLVETRIAAQCGRCLKTFERNIVNDKVCHFYEDENITSDDLDISEDIREDLLLNLPLNPLCDDECKGFCPHCGVYLNDSPCACKPENNDDDDIWEDLNKIKFEK